MPRVLQSNTSGESKKCLFLVIGVLALELIQSDRLQDGGTTSEYGKWKSHCWIFQANRFFPGHITHPLGSNNVQNEMQAQEVTRERQLLIMQYHAVRCLFIVKSHDTLRANQILFLPEKQFLGTTVHLTRVSSNLGLPKIKASQISKTCCKTESFF